MVDQLLIDSAITDEVRERKRNLEASFYDYQKPYDMVRHDWITRVFTWMGYPSKLINVLKQLMDGWKTKLEVNDGGEIKTSRCIRILKGFLQGDSYSPMGFRLTEVTIAMLMDETEGYKLDQPGRRCIKRTRSLFIDDIKVFQKNHQILEIANEMFVKASMDTGACCGLKKCAEIVFRKGKMVKGEGLPVLEEKMKALDPQKNDVCKFLGCEQSDDIDVKKVLERVKKETKKRTEHLVKLYLNDKNLMKAINCRVIPVSGYIVNVCMIRKGELEELDKTVKDILRERKFHRRQANDERLYMRREEGGRGLISFKDVCACTKVRVACYMAASTGKWIKVAWANECSKEHTSAKKTAEEVMAEIKVDVEFGMGNVSVGNKTADNWKTAWKILRTKLQQGLQRNKMKRLSQKNMQSEIPRNHTTDDYRRLKCNTDPAKTAAVFSMQEQMVETMAWKKIRGLSDNDQCRLCQKQKETVQHLLAGWKELASTEYVRRHTNALKVLAVRWAINKGVLPPDTKWWNEN